MREHHTLSFAIAEEVQIAGAPTCDILVTGSNLTLKDDFLGISSIALVTAGSRKILFDVGGNTTRFAMLKALDRRGLERVEGEGELAPGLTFFSAPGHTPGHNPYCPQTPGRFTVPCVGGGEHS